MTLHQHSGFGDPAALLELEEEQGQRCYDCQHGCTRMKCDKKLPDYPNEGRSTCDHFIFDDPQAMSEADNDG